MGRVIHFPLIRRNSHVALSWDDAWNHYRIEAVGRDGSPTEQSWVRDYGEAMDCALALGEALGLLVIDLSDDGREADE